MTLPRSTRRVLGKIDPASTRGVSWTDLVVEAGALVALPMQETSGTTLADVSGNGRDFSLTGTHTVGSSGPGVTKAVAFGGGYAAKSYASWMNVSAITIEMAFKTSNLAASATLAARDGGSSNRPWTVQMLSTGKIQAFGNNQTGPVKSTTATGLDDGNWHFFAWAVDSSGGGHHVVDSAVDNTYTGGGTLVTPTSVDMFVARNSVSGIANWSGSIAWFAMFGSKLSVATLLEHRATISGLS